VLVFATEGGLVKRTELKEFSNPRAGGIIAAGVKDGDRILDVLLSDSRAELLLLTRDGRAIRFDEREVSTMGRTAQGVKGIDLRGDDRLVGIVPIRRDARILAVTEQGWGKRTPVGEFPLQKRGGLGTLASPVSTDAGPVVAALEVVDGDEVSLVTAGGVVDRVEATAVPIQGRRTRGSRLVKVAKGDRVVEVTRSLAVDRDGDGGDPEPGPGGGPDGGPDGGSDAGSPGQPGEVLDSLAGVQGGDDAEGEAGAGPEVQVAGGDASMPAGAAAPAAPAAAAEASEALPSRRPERSRPAAGAPAEEEDQPDLFGG